MRSLYHPLLSKTKSEQKCKPYPLGVDIKRSVLQNFAISLMHEVNLIQSNPKPTVVFDTFSAFKFLVRLERVDLFFSSPPKSPIAGSYLLAMAAHEPSCIKWEKQVLAIDQKSNLAGLSPLLGASG